MAVLFINRSDNVLTINEPEMELLPLSSQILETAEFDEILTIQEVRNKIEAGILDVQVTK